MIHAQYQFVLEPGVMCMGFKIALHHFKKDKELCTYTPQ